MALFKNGFITGQAKTSTYFITVIVGMGVGLWINYIEVSRVYKAQFDFIKISEQLKFASYEIRRVLVTMGYISILILLYKTLVGKKY